MNLTIIALGGLIVAVNPPATVKDPVVETLHGVKVSDPYRWLESGEDPKVVAWTDAQNAYMRKILDAVPGREDVSKRLWELHEIGALGVPVPKGKGKAKRYFYTRRTGKQNQPVLLVRTGLETADRTLLDVNALSADGTAALDWWVPTEDGRLLAYGVSRGGSEESELRVLDVATGKDLPDVIARTRHVSLAWTPDGKGFYYTRYPAKGEVAEGDENYFRAVFFHRLGTDPKTDRKIFGEGREKADWPGVALSPDGRWLVVDVGMGWAKSEVYLFDTKAKGKPQPIALVTGRDALTSTVELTNDRIYFMSNDGAPRYQVFAVDPKRPAKKDWTLVVPESTDTLESVSLVGGQLAARYLVDASSRVRLLSLKGKLLKELPLPVLGTVDGFGAQAEGDELFFRFYSFLQPSTVFRHDLKSGKTVVWQRLEAPLDPSLFDVQQVKYPSKDKTEIPMFMVYKKGLIPNGKNPTLLYGYGGFNNAETPIFAARMAPFIEQGGVYCVANLRGGSEYGEDWHRAGMLKNKQNVFDDFIAAAEYLIREKITSPAYLGASGRSNGGLLAGAALTQRPDLFAAVISGVPLLDMVRYHKFRIARLWIPEYGDPDKADDFAWLYAYSPYHRVKDGTKYPATFLFSAESDTRVDPLHARKMTARLQAATRGGRPVLLRMERQAGHGAGKPLAKIIDQYTDELAFLFLTLGKR